MSDNFDRDMRINEILLKGLLLVLVCVLILVSVVFAKTITGPYHCDVYRPLANGAYQMRREVCPIQPGG